MMKKIKGFLRYFRDTYGEILFLPSAIFRLIKFAFQNIYSLRERTVYLAWHWSFGHQFLCTDLIVRTQKGAKMTAVFIPHKRNNPYLFQCYKEYFDVIELGSPKCPPCHLSGHILYAITLKFFRFLNWCGWIKTLLIKDEVYSKYLVDEGTYFYSEKNHAKIKNSYNILPYFRMLKRDKHTTLRLPEETRTKCLKIIEEKYGALNEGCFVTLALRSKGIGGDDYTDANRSSGEQRNYIKAIKYLSDRGFKILGVSETDINTFSAVEGFMSFEQTTLDVEAFNLFALLECDYFIGQHSGPLLLPASVGRRVLITDGYPLWQCLPRDDCIFLHKRFVDADKQVDITWQQLYNEHRKVFYGKCSEQIELRENTSEEILNAVKQLIGEHEPLNEEELKSFWSNFPEDTFAYRWQCQVPRQN